MSGSEVWEGVVRASAPWAVKSAAVACAKDPPSHHDSALVIKELLQRSREAPDSVAQQLESD